ncbi:MULTISPECIES: hypothetical protein [Methylomonas]|uniref:Uncharacterized protein n=2 Tax=Methylomonas TaxID=416 RepID=A0A126T3Z1_9GAMM|nr:MULTISPECIES: hypothetical protein [Methylomonas]AMK76780.1 hypothetical protein JT25_009800 [Methylomonas denitrificans]OAH96354.1 hypothetical protein A1342_21195 [Methylomonas methanica]TCV75217.1 hypothetical protein EDE11_13622 [Methylomonas methanica]
MKLQITTIGIAKNNKSAVQAFKIDVTLKHIVGHRKTVMPDCWFDRRQSRQCRTELTQPDHLAWQNKFDPTVLSPIASARKRRSAAVQPSA